MLLEVDRIVPAVVSPNTHLPLLGPANMPVLLGGKPWPRLQLPSIRIRRALALHFRAIEDGGSPGPYRSDYRCQLRSTTDPIGGPDADVRVYFVGRDHARAGDDVPALIAFLDRERQRERWHEGSAFELSEGSRGTATGVVHAIATRRSET